MAAFEDTTPFVLALLITFTVLVCIAMWNNFKTVNPEKKYQKPLNEGPSRTRELLFRFTSFYNQLPGNIQYIYDAEMLPDPKQHIVHAFYVGYDESETDEDRLAIKNGLETLVQFQDLVGEEPLAPPFDDKQSGEIDENFFNKNYDDDLETMTDEQKKYFEFCQKRDFELELHFAHLKIENNTLDTEQSQTKES